MSESFKDGFSHGSQMSGDPYLLSGMGNAYSKSYTLTKGQASATIATLSVKLPGTLLIRFAGYCGYWSAGTTDYIITDASGTQMYNVYPSNSMGNVRQNFDKTLSVVFPSAGTYYVKFVNPSNYSYVTGNVAVSFSSVIVYIPADAEAGVTM